MSPGKLRLLIGFLFGLLLLPAFLSLTAAAQTTAPNEWTWISGSSALTCIVNGQPGFCHSSAVYGTLGTPAAGNIPGGRYFALTWTDSSGNLWLFGGYGVDANGYPGMLNDLWEFNTSTNEWAWVGGSNTESIAGGGQPGKYGTLGTPAAGNIPGFRYGSSSWTDNNGHFWLFGGEGIDSVGNVGELNDLWEFDPSMNKWAWMGGSNTIGNSFGQSGVYGTPGVPAPGNMPGARNDASSWTDRKGYFWLFGGYGVDTHGNIGLLNDLWEFDPSSNEWAWMSGSNTVGNIGPSGVYGTPGAPASGNVPGGRSDSSNWTDVSGHLWLYGGSGFDVNGDVGALDDVWEFDPSTKEWAWMEGVNVILPSTVRNPYPSILFCASNAEYGMLGIPAVGDSPGGVEDASSWTDSNGKFWLFGGQSGYSPCVFVFNDVWEFDPSMNEWAWMGGSNMVYTIAPPQSPSGEYGNPGVPASGNTPGGRYFASKWTDSGGHFWLFGGYGYDASGNGGYLNDLWEFQPVAPYTPAAMPAFSVSAGTYSSAQTVTISDATSGAVIYYTTDGVTTPTINSTLYTSPVIVLATETIQAIAVAPSYIPSAVASATYTIPPDFTIAASMASATVTPGQSIVTLVVTPLYNFNSKVSFSCTSGLPAGGSCSFSPTTVTPSGGPVSTVLTVNTTATTAALHRGGNPFFPGSALAVAFCCFSLRKRRRLQLFLLLAMSVAGLSLFTGCSKLTTITQPTTSTVTVTATSGSLSHTTSFTLNGN